MNTLEILILFIIIVACLSYVIFYITRPFKREGNPCDSCPSSGSCGKERKWK